MKHFGHKRPVRDVQGNIVNMQDSPACAVTLGSLGFGFGPDSKRRLVVSLEQGDLITLRPQGTQRAEKISAVDVYRYTLRCKANLITLEKARERKARKAQALADARQRRAEKRLTREAHNHNAQ